MRRLLSLLVLAALFSGDAVGADPQPYDVTLKPSGDSALDSTLRDSSTLVTLREKAPVGGFALVQRAMQDVDRFKTVLQSFGYYQATIDVTVAGHPLSDPTLPDIVARLPAEPPVPVIAAITPGPLFHLGRIDVRGEVPPNLLATLALQPGAPARAADVLAARERLLTALRDAGHPLAKVELEPASLRPGEHLLDVGFAVEAGPSADFGPITVAGLEDMDEDFVRRRLLIHPGEQFSPTQLEKTREDLMSLGVFSMVRIEPAAQLNAQGNLPITITVAERKLHAVDFGAAYSTDLGVNLTVGWRHRNLFGGAEQLNLSAGMGFGGNAIQEPGYKFVAQFIKPDFLARDQQLEISLGALKQSLDAYDQRAVTQAVGLNRKFSPHWSGSIGLAAVQEEITQQGVTQRYNLLGVPIVARYDSTDSLLDPTTGIRANVSLTPTYSFGGNSATFFIMQASGSTYFNLAGNGRSVLALRGLVGKVAGAGVFDMPPDQRFYAGGSGTVRGYRYQSVGPRFPDRTPTGGTAVSAGSVEFRQRILDSYGVVAFLDGGQVSADGAPFTSNWRIGAGAGVRYYTSIGPIRLDVAVPLNKQPGDDAFELYIGIGQAF